MKKIKKAKILFIEDDLDQILLYQKKFELEGYDFIFAENGTDGIKKAEQEAQDIILLDIIMCDENGMDVLAKLKKNIKTKNIPVIIFTNLDKEELVNKAFNLGAIDYIIKSKVVPADIVNKVAEVIKDN